MERTVLPTIAPPCLPARPPAISRLPSRPPAISHLLQTATSIDHLKQLHAHLIKQAHLNHHLTSPPFLSSLLSSSLSNSSLRYCLSFFLSSSDPIHLLNTTLRSVEPHVSLLAYSRFRCTCITIDQFGLSAVLRAIGKDKTGVADFYVLSEAHGYGVKMGFVSDPVVETAIMGSYAAAGRISCARQVFDRMLKRDHVAWSIMLNR